MAFWGFSHELLLLRNWREVPPTKRPPLTEIGSRNRTAEPPGPTPIICANDSLIRRRMKASTNCRICLGYHKPERSEDAEQAEQVERNGNRESPRFG